MQPKFSDFDRNLACGLVQVVIENGDFRSQIGQWTYRAQTKAFHIRSQVR
jgi:hypothetical protein